MKRILLTGAALALAWPAAAQHAAHEHGVAELEVAVDGKRLLIELRSPLDNLVGFEHAPKDDAQRKSLADAEGRLRGFTGLFVPPTEAGCELRSVDLDSPYPQDAEGGSAEVHGYADDHGHGPDDGHGQAHDGHAHADEHGHGDGHAEMHVSYELECADPSALKHVEVGLADAFPRMQQVRAVTATERGQGAVTLDKSRRSLPL